MLAFFIHYITLAFYENKILVREEIIAFINAFEGCHNPPTHNLSHKTKNILQPKLQKLSSLI